MFSDRVRVAREYRGLRQTDVADALDISRSSFTGWETGFRRRVDDAMLDRLATVLRFPREFFLQATGSEDGRQVRLRASRRLSASTVDRLTHTTQMIDDLVRGVSSQLRWNQHRLPDCSQGNIPVTEAAARVRASLGVTRLQPIENLTAALECAGVLVHTVRWGDENEADDDVRNPEYWGFSGWVGEYGTRPMIVTRDTDSWERARWALAYELGHLVLHGRNDLDDDDHLAAQRFANELLCPLDLLVEQAGPPELWTLGDLRPIKDEWKISLRALILHGYLNGLISEDRKNGLLTQLSNRGWTRDEPGHDLYPVERPQILAHVFKQAYGTDTLTPAVYTAISRDCGFWPPADLEALLNPVLGPTRLGDILPFRPRPVPTA